MNKNTQIKKGDYVLIPRGKEFFGDDYIIQPEEVEEVNEDGSIRAYSAHLEIDEFELTSKPTQIETVEEAKLNKRLKMTDGGLLSSCLFCNINVDSYTSSEIISFYTAMKEYANVKKQQDEAKILSLKGEIESWKGENFENIESANKTILKWEAKYKELLDSHNELLELIKSDSVYALLRQGVKRPSSTGMDDCDENDYFELYNISTKLRNQQS